ncbi:helix-turn-helix domain-containing protein [Pseudoalteromonas luteoviolacea]|uniref:helix-turn-helix domain-containing protein n=1 Tax=Pseudoalteromonas luteoviolacea TaxID=43657 RepID=UPI001B379893|nr:helix-turn-helix domain-containing protein [Pseudoalteromonas luteoviolacea]MBQ4838694.1 hypothetical protein [Pseudoalteromonas luteoviolacea]
MTKKFNRQSNIPQRDPNKGFCRNKKQVFFAPEVLKATRSDTQTLVLGHIAYHHAKHNKFNSSVSAIAKHLNYSVNAVKNALKKLLEPSDGGNEALLREEPNPNSYSRQLFINTKHPLGYRLLQSYVQMLNKQQSQHTLRLYGVQLHLFESKTRYDSRHQHKMLMLHALIAGKINAVKLSKNSKRESYCQSIGQLAQKLGWAYMTVKALLQSINEFDLLEVMWSAVNKPAFILFSIKSRIHKPQNSSKLIDNLQIPIERYRS